MIATVCIMDGFPSLLNVGVCTACMMDGVNDLHEEQRKVYTNDGSTVRIPSLEVSHVCYHLIWYWESEKKYFNIVK